MGTMENKAVSANFIEEVFNLGNYEAFDDFLADDFVAHLGAGSNDRAEFIEMVKAYRTGFPDYDCIVEDQVAEGDKVVTRWTFQGTQTGEVMGIPPTGKRVSVTGVAIDRIVDGKMVEAWLEMDVHRMLQDLGAAPRP
jgi:steroid delta-isomerase-like uncharacterized protein